MDRLEELAASLASAVKPIDDLVGSAEAILIALVGRLASWGASVPNAVMVARSAQSTFSLSWGLAIAIAVSLELISHALVEHWQNAKAWNVTKYKSDPEIDTSLSFRLMFGYWIIDFIMVGALAVSTYLTTGNGQIFIALCYPAIGVAVALVTNERAYLFRLQQAHAREKKERQNRRDERKAERDPDQFRISSGDSEQTPIRKAAEILQEDPDISGAELGRRVGVTERYGRTLLKRVRKNGH